MPKIIGGSLEEHRERTREKIFQALDELLKEQTFEQITFSSIAGAAGVGRTAMYNHFPDRETLQKIVDVHYPKISGTLVSEALDIFFDVRKVPGLKKKPSTSELVDWLKLLMADNIGEAVLRERDPTKAIPPLAGALVKNEQDVQLLERLAFMSRRASR